MLHRQGRKVSEKTVARMMKEQGLKSRTVKKYKATTNSKHNLPVAENVLNRQFRPKAPNQAWVTDITYIATDRGTNAYVLKCNLIPSVSCGYSIDSNTKSNLKSLEPK
ncbi:hypothetical protein ASF12_24255 [Paenibacillus sp. Leaf72]|nr:hypothetical protein ASF12_24255 [Paenibacillus sp. Leaf72]